MNQTVATNSRLILIRNYIVTYFLIAFSGIPFFDNPNKATKLAFLIFVFLIFVFTKKGFSNKIIFITILTLILLIIQTIVFSAGSLFTYITFISFTIFLPYFILKVLGLSFLKYYRDILLVLAIIALIFWSLTNFYPGFFKYTYYVAGKLLPYTGWERQESIILYTVEFTQIYGFHRNPGPFHEPGAYCVFLILGIIAELYISGKLLTWKNIVFIVSIFTSLSTAGYLAVFILISFYLLINKKLNVIFKVLILIPIVYYSFYMYNELDFLKQKINNQIQDQSSKNISNTITTGRFVGIRKSFIVMYRHPIYGRGLLAATQPENTDIEAAGYGWIYWISRTGVILGALYMFFMYKTMENYARVNGLNRKYAIVFFLALLVVLGAQKHTSIILFFMLFLVSIEFSVSRNYKLYKLKA